MVKSLQFQTIVIGMQFSRKGHLVICLENQLILWYSRDFVVRTETSINPNGTFAISENGKWLAFPKSKGVIAVATITTEGIEEVVEINTDWSTSSKVQFNRKGANKDLLAIASSDGTDVAVYEVVRDMSGHTIQYSHTKVFVFRRGRSACEVQALAFSTASDLLTLSSNSGTLHVFELCDANKYTTSYLSSIATLWQSPKAKYLVRLGQSSPVVSCLVPRNIDLDTSGESTPPQVYVVNSDGVFLEYNLMLVQDEHEIRKNIPLRTIKL